MKKGFLIGMATMMATATMAQTANGSVASATDSIASANDSITWDKALEGITVKAQRPLIKQEIDRIGYDVQADDESKTQTVMDMLRKVPMVTVDGEENIMVKGSGNFKIYKNGHLDPSMTKNAKEILKAMPATAVKRIEVITEPGAREDAEGVNAILNIVMMDNSRFGGLTGTLNGSVNTWGAPSLSTYLATQMGKAIVSLDYGYYGMTKRWTQGKGFTDRTYMASGNHERSETKGSNPGYFQHADINASYDIDSLNLLSASFGGYFYKLDVQGDGTTAMTDAAGQPLYSYGEHYWMPSYSHHSWNGRMDYQHKTRRQGELFTLSYMLALTRQHTTQETTYSEMVNFPFGYTGFLLNTRERFTEHTFQADYLRPLGKGHQLEVGAKYIDRRNQSNTAQQFTSSTPSSSPLGRLRGASTPFNHNTRIAALYADYIYHVGKWSARAGLRYEYSYMRGHYPDGSVADFDKHLNDWVPQASVKYQMSDRQSLKMAYTTSITRPGITYLNPSVNEFPNNVSYGNAHLTSVREQGFSLSYMNVGQRLTLQLTPAYKYYKGGIGQLVYVQDDVRYSTFGNILRQHRWQMEAYVQWKPFDGTTLVTNLNYADNHLKEHSSSLHQHTSSLFYYVNLSQKLPWKLLFTAYTFGQLGHQSQSVYAYSRSWQRYGFSLQRSFLKDDRLSVRINATAPFHRDMHYKTRTTQGDIIGFGDGINTQNGQSFQLTLSYRFGKLNARVKKTQTTIENSDVVGGISKGAQQ